MILQLVLINQETGEPIYDVALTKLQVVSAIGNEVFENHAHLMLRALQAYKPRMMAPVDRSTSLDPGSADFDSNIDGPVNLGY